MQVNTGKIVRMTKQRQIILEELRKVTSHPTADDLYQMVRDKMPKISLGTVYRNLEILSGSGVIQKLDIGGTQKRFDGNTSNHPHIRCVTCGRVADIDVHSDFDFIGVAEKATDFEVLRYRLEYNGICSECIEVKQAQA